MKRVFTVVLLGTISFSIYAGFNPGTIKWQNKNRKYTIYVPDIYYTEGQPVPLLLGLHGFGDDINNFSNICMTGISDTANYLAVYAEAWPDPLLGANAWHSGASVLGVPFNNGIDDVGFLNALLDTIIANYDVDTTRMYCYGFSFGAFMTNRMASEKTARFAAVAAVSGLRGNMLTAVPDREMPIVYFHGTADQTINYYNCPYGLNAQQTINFWIDNNNCDAIPVIDSIPNTVADNKTIVRYRYGNGINGSRMDHYKVIGGEHQWLGLPANDISYCQTIWSFFREYSRRTGTPTGVRNNTALQIELYPNPSAHQVNFKLPPNTGRFNAFVYDASGANVSPNVEVLSNSLSIERLPAGVYFLNIIAGDKTFTGSFVKQ